MADEREGYSGLFDIPNVNIATNKALGVINYAALLMAIMLHALKDDSGFKSLGVDPRQALLAGLALTVSCIVHDLRGVVKGVLPVFALSTLQMCKHCILRVGMEA